MTKLSNAFLIVFSGSMLFATACTTVAPPTNAHQTIAANANANAAIVAANANAAAAPSPATSPTTAANQAANSPTATVAAYHQAMLKRDEMAFRQVLSQATLREFTTFAREEGAKSLVEYWTGFSSPAARLQTRNEQIQGDTATVEIGNDENAFTKTRLVRENNVWKMDLTEAAFRQLK